MSERAEGTPIGDDRAASRIVAAFADVQGGQLERARQVFADLMHDPKYGADAYRGLAAVAWRQQHPETAVQLLRIAVAQQPTNSDAQADLALVLLTSGRAPESLVHWDQRLRLTPADAHAWHNYGKALSVAGHFDLAVAAFEQALQLAPDQSQTYALYAQALSLRGAEDRAETVWRRGIAYLPKDEALRAGLAETFFAHGQLAQCLETYRAGVAVLPESPDLQMGLGQVLEELGDRTGAEAQFRKALELRPGWAAPMGTLLSLLGGLTPEQDLAAARAVIADPLRPPADHAYAAYGLGAALDGRGDHDGAFAAWNQANAARRQQIGPFDRERLARRVDRIAAQFSNSFLEARRDWGHPSLRPIFVVGMPFSGTKLVEQILSSHPDAEGYGELPEISQICQALPERAGTLQRWPEAAAALNRNIIRQAAEDYLAALRRRRPTAATRVVDGTPANFFNIGLIAWLFPNAHIVWCQRDARDISLSMYSASLGASQRHATDLADIGFYVRQHVRLMRHWTETVRDRIHECQYEALIADPEGQSRRLMQAVNLPWDERCLRADAAGGLMPGRGSGPVPGHWTRYEKHLGPLLRALEGKLDG